jgi:hypothetical protein
VVDGVGLEIGVAEAVVVAVGRLPRMRLVSTGRILEGIRGLGAVEVQECL